MCRWFLCGIHIAGNGIKHQQSYLILKLHFIKYTYYFDINIKRVTPMILYLYLMSSLYFFLSQLITCRNICILKLRMSFKYERKLCENELCIWFNIYTYITIPLSIIYNYFIKISEIFYYWYTNIN